MLLSIQYMRPNGIFDNKVNCLGQTHGTRVRLEQLGGFERRIVVVIVLAIDLLVGDQSCKRI